MAVQRRWKVAKPIAALTPAGMRWKSSAPRVISNQLLSGKSGVKRRRSFPAEKQQLPPSRKPHRILARMYGRPTANNRHTGSAFSVLKENEV